MLEGKNGRSNSWWFLAALALSAAGLLVLVAGTRGFPWAFLRVLPARSLALAGLLVVALWLVEGLRIWWILRLLRAPLALTRVLQVNLATGFVAAITPAASGGPPTQVYLLSRAGVPAEQGLVLVTVRLVVTMLFFTLAAPATIFALGKSLALGPLGNILALAAALLLAAVACFLFYLLARPQVLRRPLAWMLSNGLVRRLVPDTSAALEALSGRVMEFSASLHLLLGAGQWPGMLAVVVLTVLYWGLYFGIAPVLLAGLGRECNLGGLLARQLVFYFAMSYVPLPGASGVAELGLAGLFGPLLPPAWLAGFVLTWRFFTYYSNILVGGPIFWLLGRQGKKSGR